jgi:hypothetical protein
VGLTGIKGRWDFTLKWTPDGSQEFFDSERGNNSFTGGEAILLHGQELTDTGAASPISRIVTK